MSDEIYFYRVSDVTVTNTRVIVPSHTYAMSGITSVRFGEIKPNRWFPLAVILLGFIMAVGAKGSIWHCALFILPGIIWLPIQKSVPR